VPTGRPLPGGQLPLLQSLRVQDLRKLNFPDAADPQDTWKLATARAKAGWIATPARRWPGRTPPWRSACYDWALVLHTGEAAWPWAVVLGLAGASVPLFWGHGPAHLVAGTPPGAAHQPTTARWRRPTAGLCRQRRRQHLGLCPGAARPRWCSKATACTPRRWSISDHARHAPGVHAGRHLWRRPGPGHAAWRWSASRASPVAATL
jgi:hypothetical protein